MVSWLQRLRHLLVRELRSALRERGVVTGSLLLPLVLGPLALWLLISVVALAQGGEEARTMRLAPAQKASPRQVLGEALGEELAQDLAQGRLLWLEPPADPRVALAEGQLDGVITPRGQGADPADELHLVVDRSSAAGRHLEQRLDDATRIVRQQRIKERIDQRIAAGGPGNGPPDETLATARQPFELEARNLAPASNVAGFLLAQVVPLLAVIMVALGCFYPAIDCTAGERERSTWETSLALAVPRRDLVLAKYLHVALLGAVAGLLNLGSLVLTLRAIVTPLVGETHGLDFIPGLGTWILAVAAVVLLALVIAAGMLLFAGLARGFREGQALAGPFLLVTLLPALWVQAPDMTLGYGKALVPVASTVLMLREALVGQFAAGPIALALVSQAAVVALCLALARRAVERDEVWLGTPRWHGWLLRALGRKDDNLETPP